MDVMEFWQLVEQHPELPRIVGGFWDELERTSKEERSIDPTIVARFFSPSAIQKRIASISYKPWEELDQSACSTGGMQKIEGTDSRVNLYNFTFYFALLHDESQYPFAEIHSFDIGTLSVSDIIKHFTDRNKAIDAIARIQQTRLERRTALTPEEPSEKRVWQLDKGDPTIKEAIEVFVPPPGFNR